MTLRMIASAHSMKALGPLSVRMLGEPHQDVRRRLIECEVHRVEFLWLEAVVRHLKGAIKLHVAHCKHCASDRSYSDGQHGRSKT
jgi:hypothetical protein